MTTESRGPENQARGFGQRLKSAAQNVTLLGVTLVLMLGLLEVGVRLLTDTRPSIKRRHAVLGQTYVPGFEGRMYVAEAGREVDLRFNREGFRGEDLPYDKPIGTRRVALLGDSMVVAVACDEEHTAAVELGQLLNEFDSQARWEVLNFGVSGASTGQELVLYREVAARYDPDIVVTAFFMGNDVTDNSSELSHNFRIYFEIDDEGRLTQLPFNVTRGKLSAWLNAHSRLYVWQKAIRKTVGEDGIHKSLASTDDDRHRRAWELNERLIVALRDEVERRGSRFVLALYPAAEQVDPGQWDAMLAQAGDRRDEFEQGYTERRLLDICEAHDVAVVSMTEAFRGALEVPGAPDLYNNGNGHFNHAGNLLAARLISRFLKEQYGWVTQGPVAGAGP